MSNGWMDGLRLWVFFVCHELDEGGPDQSRIFLVPFPLSRRESNSSIDCLSV